MTYPPGQPPYQQPYPPPGTPYGQYGQQPYPPYPAARSTNGLAIAALILGITGFIWINIVLAVIFGIIALSQIKRRGQQGRGMAIAGLALAGLWTVVYAVVIVLIVVTADNTSVRAVDVKVGDCIKDVPSDASEVFRVPKVACNKPHHSEVFAIFPVSGNDFPGQDAIESEYGSKCGPALEDYAPDAAGDPLIRIDILYPILDGWKKGDRDVVCIATSTLEKTASIKK